MKKEDAKTFVHGDYVLSPCQNVFNKKISYWISKKGYTVALYAFTPMDKKDLDYHTSENSWNGYIKYYESFIREKRQQTESEKEDTSLYRNEEETFSQYMKTQRKLREALCSIIAENGKIGVSSVAKRAGVSISDANKHNCEDMIRRALDTSSLNIF